MKRAEKSEVRDAKVGALARNEGQLLHFNVVRIFQNFKNARQSFFVEIFEPETFGGTEVVDDFGKCFDDFRCVGREPVPVDVEVFHDPAQLRFSSDDPVPGPASLSDAA